MNQALNATFEVVARATRGTSGGRHKVAPARAPCSHPAGPPGGCHPDRALDRGGGDRGAGGAALAGAGGGQVARAQTTRCTAHLRQFALALPLYAADHADRLPPNADGRQEALGAKWVEGWLGLPGLVVITTPYPQVGWEEKAASGGRAQKNQKSA
jgi:hypothetical protein